mmetsp:Transcript_5784/g.14353  ORF Transcript_5784/g.14353 Transcript_5784/m.14353 type:complete len:361 (+) Transcript_5784:561-1643(+)
MTAMKAMMRHLKSSKNKARKRNKAKGMMEKKKTMTMKIRQTRKRRTETKTTMTTMTRTRPRTTTTTTMDPPVSSLPDGLPRESTPRDGPPPERIRRWEEIPPTTATDPPPETTIRWKTTTIPTPRGAASTRRRSAIPRPTMMMMMMMMTTMATHSRITNRSSDKIPAWATMAPPLPLRSGSTRDTLPTRTTAATRRTRARTHNPTRGCPFGPRYLRIPFTPPAAEISRKWERADPSRCDRCARKSSWEKHLSIRSPIRRAVAGTGTSLVLCRTRGTATAIAITQENDKPTKKNQNQNQNQGLSLSLSLSPFPGTAEKPPRAATPEPPATGHPRENRGLRVNKRATRIPFPACRPRWSRLQ